jgi:hypothetical protein
MNLRKIAVLGGFAAGAALTLAPLASADPAATDPVTSLLSGEESTLNSIFVTDADLAGVGKDVIPATNTYPFDTIPLADAPNSGTPTILDYELYGLNPIANASGDPGSYNVFNGALTEFDDATNVEAYALANSGALDTNVADYIGSAHEITTALGTDTATGAFTDFFSTGLADLSGLL